MVWTKSRANVVDGVRFEPRVQAGGETESFTLAKEDAEIPNVLSVRKGFGIVILSKNHEPPGFAMNIFHFPPPIIIILLVQKLAVPLDKEKFTRGWLHKVFAHETCIQHLPLSLWELRQATEAQFLILELVAAEMQRTHVETLVTRKVEGIVSFGVHEIRGLQEWERGKGFWNESN